MRTTTAIALLLTAIPADACHRCGQSRCRFVSHQAVKVEQVAVPQQILNIANVYPQGDTVYTVGQASQLYAANPDLAVTLAAKIAGNGTDAFTAAVRSGQASNEALAQIAKVQAATQHLKAAVGSNEGAKSLTLQITQSGGGIQVRPVTDDASPSGKTPTAAGSLLSSKCASCHGTQLTAPKGGLFYDAGHSLDADTSMRALSVLSGKDVPSAMVDVVGGLTAEEKGRLMEEILEAWER